MSYQQAMYDREHPRYSEPTEYITMEVDGLIVALHFKNASTHSLTQLSEIEQTLLMTQDFENLSTSPLDSVDFLPNGVGYCVCI